MMSVRRRLAVRRAADASSMASYLAATRWNGTQPSGSSTPPTGGSQEPTAKRYDREEELRREEAARAELFKGGFPSPAKMFREMQNQQAAGGAAGGAAGAGGAPRKGVVQEAWQEAMNETTKRFFGKDAAPPQDIKGLFVQAAGAAEQIRGRVLSGVTGAAQPPPPPPPPSGDAQSTSTPPPPPPPEAGSNGLPPNPFAGAPFAFRAGPSSSQGGRTGPNMGRIFAGLTIMWCSLWMMRRNGMFGDFRHVQVPFWCVGPEDTAKWLLFVFNLDDRRRAELQQQFITARQMNPTLNFFDFVDSAQPDWRSSPTHSREAVLAAVSSLVRTDSSFRSIGIVKAGLDSGSGMLGGFFGGDASGATPLQKRVDGLMKMLPLEHASAINMFSPAAVAQVAPIGGHYGWTAAHRPPAVAPGYGGYGTIVPTQQQPPVAAGWSQQAAPSHVYPQQPASPGAPQPVATMTPQQQQAYWQYMQQQQQLWYAQQQQQQQQQQQWPQQPQGQWQQPVLTQQYQQPPQQPPQRQQQQQQQQQFTQVPVATPEAVTETFSATAPPVPSADQDTIAVPAALPSVDPPLVDVLEHSFKNDGSVTQGSSNDSFPPAPTRAA